MLTKMIARLSYANVVATLALFLALGGGAVAATQLARNSVGSAQIRAGAVASPQVRNRSLHLVDLSTSTRTALRGQQGPPGPAGPPAVGYFAVVGAAGQFVRGNASSGGHTEAGSGIYTIAFKTNVSACAYSATLGTPDAAPPPVGLIAVSSGPNGTVLVQTTDTTGNPKDLPFHLIVAC